MNIRGRRLTVQLIEMIVFDGMSDIGIGRERQEDVIYQIALDSETFLFIVADGIGGLEDQYNPAGIACTEVVNLIKRRFEREGTSIFDNADSLMDEAFYLANRVLGVFNALNDERFPNFGCSMTCCIVHKEKVYFSHCGNTRLHLITTNKNKEPKIIQMTVDHTANYNEFLQNKIDEREYMESIAMHQLTSNIGSFADPQIQTGSFDFKNGVIVITSDGIHCALWQHIIMELVLTANNTKSAVRALIDAAKIRKYEDNMSTIVIFNEKG